MAENKLLSLYNTLSTDPDLTEAGDNNFGSYDDFKEVMQDPHNIESVYNFVSKKGGYGTLDEFSASLQDTGDEVQTPDYDKGQQVKGDATAVSPDEPYAAYGGADEEPGYPQADYSKLNNTELAKRAEQSLTDMDSAVEHNDEEGYKSSLGDYLDVKSEMDLRKDDPIYLDLSSATDAQLQQLSSDDTLNDIESRTDPNEKRAYLNQHLAAKSEVKKRADAARHAANVGDVADVNAAADVARRREATRDPGGVDKERRANVNRALNSYERLWRKYDDGSGKTTSSAEQGISKHYQRYNDNIRNARKMSDEQLWDNFETVMNTTYREGDTLKAVDAIPLMEEIVSREKGGGHAETIGERNAREFLYGVGGAGGNGAWRRYGDNSDVRNMEGSVAWHYEQFLQGGADHVSDFNRDFDSTYRDVPIFAIAGKAVSLIDERLNAVAERYNNRWAIHSPGESVDLSEYRDAVKSMNITDAIKTAMSGYDKNKLLGYIAAFAEKNDLSIDEATARVNELIFEQVMERESEAIAPKNEFDYWMRTVLTENFAAQMVKGAVALSAYRPGEVGAYHVEERAKADYLRTHADGFVNNAVTVSAELAKFVLDGYGGAFKLPGLFAKGAPLLLGGMTTAGTRALMRDGVKRYASGALGGALNFMAFQTEMESLRQLRLGDYSGMALLDAAVKGLGEGAVFGAVGGAFDRMFLNARGWQVPVGEALKFVGEGGTFATFGYLESGGNLTMKDLASSFGMALIPRMQHFSQWARDVDARFHGKNGYANKVRVHKISKAEQEDLESKGYTYIAMALRGSALTKGDVEHLSRELDAMRGDKEVPWEYVRMADWVLNGRIEVLPPVVKYIYEDNGESYSITPQDENGRAINGTFTTRNEAAFITARRAMDVVINQNNMRLAERAALSTSYERAIARAAIASCRPGEDAKAVYNLYRDAQRKVNAGEQLGEIERDIYDSVNAQLKDMTLVDEAAAYKAVLKRAGYDVDSILKKHPDEWTSQERMIIDKYEQWLSDAQINADAANGQDFIAWAKGQTQREAATDGAVPVESREDVTEAERGGVDADAEMQSQLDAKLGDDIAEPHEPVARATEQPEPQPAENREGATTEGVPVRGTESAERVAERGTPAHYDDAVALYPSAKDLGGEDLEDLLYAMEIERNEAHRYANGEIDEKPENYDYWAARDGLVKNEATVEPEESVASPGEPQPAEPQPINEGVGAAENGEHPVETPTAEPTGTEAVPQPAELQERATGENGEIAGATEPIAPTGANGATGTVETSGEVEGLAADDPYNMPMVNKGGGRMSPNYEKATAEQIFEFLINKSDFSVPGMLGIINGRIKRYDDELKAHDKKEPTQEKVARRKNVKDPVAVFKREHARWERERDKIETQRSKWADVRGELMSQENMNIRTNGNDARKTAELNEELGEYDSVEDYVMRSLAAMGKAFRWGSKVHGVKGDITNPDKIGSGDRVTHGLGAHLGLLSNPTERKKYFGWIDPKGLYPEEVAERLHANMPERWADQYSTMDILDMMIDFMRRYSRPRDLMEAAAESRQESDPDNYEREAEYRAADEAAESRHFDTVEDMLEYEEAASRSAYDKAKDYVAAEREANDALGDREADLREADEEQMRADVAARDAALRRGEEQDGGVQFRAGESDARLSGAGHVERVRGWAANTDRALGTRTRVVTYAELPASVRRQVDAMERRGVRTTGFFDPATGETVVIADRVSSEGEAVATVWHENVGHKGMEQMLGNRYGEWLDRVSELARGEHGQLWTDLAQRYSAQYDAGTDAGRRGLASEFIAEAAERRVSEPSLWARVRGMARRFLIENFNVRMTDADLDYMLWKAAKQVRKSNGLALMRERAEEALLKKRAEDEWKEFMTTWHGSGAEFDAFDHSHMGEGEGAQAYGWGTYVTQVNGIARSYAKSSARRGMKAKFRGLDTRAKINSYLNKRYNSPNWIANRIVDIIAGLGDGESFATMKAEVIGNLETRLNDIERHYERFKNEVAAERMVIERIENMSDEEYANANFWDLSNMALDARNYAEYHAWRAAAKAREEIARSQSYGSEQPDKERVLDQLRRMKDLNNNDGMTRAYEADLASARETLEFLQDLKESDFEVSRDNRHLYQVEIPDDNGSNYLSYIGRMNEQPVILKRVADALEADGWSKEDVGGMMRFTKNGERIILRGVQQGRDLYAELSLAMGGDKAASQFLHDKCGLVGIKYPAEYRSGGRSDGAKNFVIFNEADAQITDHERFRAVQDSIKKAKENAEVMPAPIEFNRENWDRTFPDGKVVTPLGEVKIGENQFEKMSNGRQGELGPTFYSNAERAVENVKQNKATAEQWKSMLTKAGGIKAGEDKWMGLSQWLDENKGKSLTKDEVMQFIADNGVRMEEFRYTEHPKGFDDLKREYDRWQRTEGFDYAQEQLRERFGDDADIAFDDLGGELVISNEEAAAALLGSEQPINSTRLDYTTEGLENKREIAFVVDGIEPYQQGDAIHFGPENEGRAVMWVRFGETTDADGKRVLVIDEIQSNRHQDAREKGYREQVDNVSQERLDAAREAMYDASHTYNEYEAMLKEKHGFDSIDGSALERRKEWRSRMSDEERHRLKELGDAFKDAQKTFIGLRDGIVNPRGIPAAPFEKNWHEVAMKRMLRLAAEEGFDKVAWTTGEQQAKRYDLGDKVDDITVEPYQAETPDEVDGFDVDINIGNARVSMYVTRDGEITSSDGYVDDFTGKRLAEVVGKEMAEKILSSHEYTRLEGEDLRIGGEGMKGFYDQMLPRFMDKYGKKWGVKTGTVELPNVEDAGRRMHSVDVTPEMKESVMQGQPLFREKLAEGGTLKIERVTPPGSRETVSYITGQRMRVPDGEGEWRIEGMPGTYPSREAALDAFRNRTQGSVLWDISRDGERIHILGAGDAFEALRGGGAKQTERLARWQQQREADGREQINALGEHMGITVKYVDDMSDAERAGLSERQQAAKGWFNPDTGEIFINLHNHHRSSDMVATMLHEAVGHKGLRDLFGEDFDTFLDNVWYNVKLPIGDELRRRRDALLAREGNTLNAREAQRLAVEEYMSEFAEEGRFDTEAKATLWQKFKGWLTEKLRKLGFNGVLSDENLRYVLWKSYQNQLKQGEMIAKAKDVAMRNKLGIGKDDAVVAAESRIQEPQDSEPRGGDSGLRFRASDVGAQSERDVVLSDVPRITDENRDNKDVRVAAMKAIGGNLSKLRQAMSKQRTYDRETVKLVTDFAKQMIDNGLLSGMSDYEAKQVLTKIKNATGKEDITNDVNKLVDLMIKHQLKAGKVTFAGLLDTKPSRVDSRGIVVAAGLDDKGTRILNAVKAGLTLDPVALTDRINDVIDKLDDPSDVVRENAEAEYDGLMIAQRYLDTVKQRESYEAQYKQMLEDAKAQHKNGHITNTDYKQYKQAVEEQIRDNRIGMIEDYGTLAETLGFGIESSKERLKQWRDEQRLRAEEIRHDANRDMQGTDADIHMKPKRGAARVKGTITDSKLPGAIQRVILSPLGTFDTYMRYFGRKFADGAGNLYNRFVRGGIDAQDSEWKAYKADISALDRKARELFGKDAVGLYQLQNSKNKIKVHTKTGDYDLTQLQAAYIYCVNKQADGRMKLRSMGIDESQVQAIADKINPNIIKFFDWVQEDFLPGMRERLNETHKRMFGASMDNIVGYFPLRINMLDVPEKETLSAGSRPSTERTQTSVGGIMKRTINNKALDITRVDALQVLLEHIREMEHWNSFAELSRDLNTLLSYKRFKTQVINSTSLRYGNGKNMWEDFVKCAQIVTGNYTPSTGKFNTDVADFTSAWAASNIAFRFWTAMKQFQSGIVGATQANWWYLTKDLTKALSYGADNTWNWAIANLPTFAERWQSRKMGDTSLDAIDIQRGGKTALSRFVSDAARIGITPNAAIDGLTVAVLGRAIYETRLRKYKRWGYDDATCERRALQDAAISVNETQQSSQGLFKSVLQTDRDVLSRVASMYRNASMGYQRMTVRGIKSFENSLSPKWRAEAYRVTKDMAMRDGLSEPQAERMAKSVVRREFFRGIANMVMFGAIAPITWAGMGKLLPMLFTGQDDDKQISEEVNKSLVHGISGFVEGLVGGATFGDMAEFLYDLSTDEDAKVSDARLPENDPLLGELRMMKQKASGKPYEAAYDLANLFLSATTGVNPETFVNWYAAISDYYHGDMNTTREALLLAARILNMPESATQKVYVDELMTTSDEAKKLSAEELAARYARYKRLRGAGYMNLFSSDEADASVEEKYIKKYDTMLQDRLVNMDANQLSEIATDGADEKLSRAATKSYYKQLGVEYHAKTSAGGQLYEHSRTAQDIASDVTVKQYDAKLSEVKKAWEAAGGKIGKRGGGYDTYADEDADRVKLDALYKQYRKELKALVNLHIYSEHDKKWMRELGKEKADKSAIMEEKRKERGQLLDALKTLVGDAN